MKKPVTGKNAVIKVNGKPVVYGDFPGIHAPGTYVQTLTPIMLFHDEFDDGFSNRWARKCDRLSRRQDMPSRLDVSDNKYGSVYKLCEFLWKLKVWKP
jgi:hypothetical protein